MNDEKWVVVDETQGVWQAEIIKGLLNSHNIEVWISQEGASHAYAIGVGRLGRTEILVPSHEESKARDILERYHAGEFELPDEEDAPLPDDDLPTD
jgi:hypothetical protein